MNPGVESVLSVLNQLLADLEKAPDEWENPTLPLYLEAMPAWLKDSQEKEPTPPSWELIADMLQAAKIYE